MKQLMLKKNNFITIFQQRSFKRRKRWVCNLNSPIWFQGLNLHSHSSETYWKERGAIQTIQSKTKISPTLVTKDILCYMYFRIEKLSHSLFEILKTFLPFSKVFLRSIVQVDLNPKDHLWIAIVWIALETLIMEHLLIPQCLQTNLPSLIFLLHEKQKGLYFKIVLSVFSLFEDNVNFSIPFKIVKLFYFYQLVCLEILENVW